MKQLGGLVLGSVPTMILFLITLAAYRLLVHKPLAKVLWERYARTQGAMERAAAAIEAAEGKTREYEQRVREVRAAIFRERHGRLQAVHVESEIVLADTRAIAQERIADALAAIEHSVTIARLQLESLIGGLTVDVLHAVLLPPGGASVREQVQ